VREEPPRDKIRDTRVLVAAESAVERARIEAAISARQGMCLVGSTSAPAAAAGMAGELLAEVVVLSVRSTESLLFIDAAPTHPAVLLILARPDGEAAGSLSVGPPAGDQRARAIRVQGLLPGEAGPEEICTAVAALSRGLLVVHPVFERFAGGIPDRTPARGYAARQDTLTAREIEVLRMIAEGLPNKAIAAELGITSHTVKFHIASILQKMGAQSRTEAVTLGVRHGLLLL